MVHLKLLHIWLWISTDIYGYLWIIWISMDIYGSIAISWAIDIISRGMNIHKSHLFSCEPLGLQGFDMFWPIPISGLYIPTSKLGSGILESRPRPTPHLGEGCLSARHNHGHENDDQSCDDASQRWGAKHRDPKETCLCQLTIHFLQVFRWLLWKIAGSWFPEPELLRARCW